MQSDACITNCTKYIKKYAVSLTNLNLFVRYMVSPTAREIIKQFFSNYDENACLSVYAYPRDIGLFIAYIPVSTAVDFLSQHTDAIGFEADPTYLNHREYAGAFELSRRHNNYLDFEPYTKMQLYLPCIGTIDIDPAAWYGKQIDIYFVVDFENGQITYFAVDEATGIDIGSWQGQYGVEIAVTSTRMGELAAQAVTGTITGAIEMMTGNIAGGAMTAASSIAAPFTAPAGVSGGKSGQGLAHAFDDSNPYIIETYMNPVEDDEKFAAAHGLPLQAWRDFADLSGYTVIDQVQ